MKGGVVYRK